MPQLPEERRVGGRVSRARWLGLCLCAWLAGCAHSPAKSRELVAPFRKLQVVGPTPFSAEQLSGKVVLVSFFATWCFPCLTQLPQLAELQKEFGPKGLQVVAVGMDLEGGKVLRPFADHYAMPFPVLVSDTHLRAGETDYGPLKALPTIYVLDRQGAELLAYQGVALPAELREVVARAVR